MSNPSSVIYHHAVSQPLWSLKLFFVYLGNPLVFLLYFPLALALHKLIPFIPVTTKVEINTDRISPLLFLALTLPVYILWIVGQVALYLRLAPNFQLDIFLAKMVSIPSLLFAIPGVFNILIWVTTGMEGNVMGFLLALPLLICSVAYPILWILSIRAAWTAPSPSGNDPLVPVPYSVTPEGSLA